MKQFCKRIISLVLIVATVCSMSSMAFAAENEYELRTNEKFRLADTKISINPNIEVEDALVEGVECITPKALDIIDEYVQISEDGRFVISDEADLRKSLTAEQYKVVQAQILAANRQEVMAKAAAVGTSGNPYELTAGTKKTVTASEYWFSCTIRGATDFTLSSGKSATMTIYKKTLFGKTQLYSAGSKTSLTKTISDCSINNGSNKYLIYVKPSASASISCTVKQHKDSYTRAKGAMWQSNNTSAIPDTNLLYFKYWYIPKDEVSDMVDYVTDANFLDYQSRLIRGTITAASIIATGGFSLPAAFVSGMGFFALTESIDFKSAVIKDIKTAGGYNASTRTYANGVLLKEVVSNGITFYYVEKWSGGTMYGPEGWTGTWTTTYNNY